MSLDDTKWHVTVSLPKSHAPCYHHILLALLMLCLHPSGETTKEFSTKDSKLGLAQLIQKYSSFLLKAKPKQWPNLNLNYGLPCINSYFVDFFGPCE